MLPRKIRDHADGRSCLDAAAASGLRNAGWAHANGVDARSLQGWRLVLDREKMRTPAAPLHLVQLVVPDAQLSSKYVVRCGALAVEVDDRFDEDVLRRLLGVVASC